MGWEENLDIDSMFRGELIAHWKCSDDKDREDTRLLLLGTYDKERITYLGQVYERMIQDQLTTKSGRDYSVDLGLGKVLEMYFFDKWENCNNTFSRTRLNNLSNFPCCYNSIIPIERHTILSGAGKESFLEFADENPIIKPNLITCLKSLNKIKY